MPQHDTSVLVVGAGPVGLMATILLRRLGIDTRLIDRRTHRSRAPAAHVVNPRTFEICRSAGVDMDALMALATDPADGGRVTWMTRLAGEEIASLQFQRQDDSMLALTPTPLRNLGQHRLEPVLQRTVEAAGGEVEFGTRWEGAAQSGDAVTSRVRDVATGAVREIRSRYLIAADGAGSSVRKSRDIPMVGPAVLRRFVMIHFGADLREIVRERPSILYWIVDPEAASTFIAHDIDREWVYMAALRSSTETIDDYAPRRCRELIWRGIDGPRPPLEIKGVSTWVMSAQVAERFRDDRVFLVGDAAHRFPPTGALGLNSGVQDVHGLAWRIAGVVSGWAPPSLLDSYETERLPIARQNAEQSLYNAKRLQQVPAALGVIEEPTTARMRATLDDPAGRSATLSAIASQAEHFNMLGMQIGFRYERGAMVPEMDAPPRVANPVTDYVPTSRPGARLPHAWIERDGERISTLDLIDPGSFTLLTWASAEAWVDAAREIDRIPLQHIVVGRDVVDMEGMWAEVGGIGPTGALLVRPDQHVAWRSTCQPEDPGVALHNAIARILAEQ